MYQCIIVNEVNAIHAKKVIAYIFSFYDKQNRKIRDSFYVFPIPCPEIAYTVTGALVFLLFRLFFILWFVFSSRCRVEFLLSSKQSSGTLGQCALTTDTLFNVRTVTYQVKSQFYTGKNILFVNKLLVLKLFWLSNGDLLVVKST